MYQNLDFIVKFYEIIYIVPSMLLLPSNLTQLNSVAPQDSIELS